jgi:hypothetical protein
MNNGTTVNGQTENTIEIIKSLRELTSAELAYVLDEGVSQILLEGEMMDEGTSNGHRFQRAKDYISLAVREVKKIS